MAMIEDSPEQVPGFEQTPVEMYRPQVLVQASLSEHEPYERQALLAWLIDTPKDFNLDQVSEVEQTYNSLINAATDGRYQLVERSVYLESAFQILQEVDGYCGSDGVIPQDDLEGHILANDDIARTILRARAFRTSHWGDDHLGSLGLLKDMNNEVSQGSLESLGRLTTSARRLQEVFPGETAEAVDEGAQRLIANLAYASSTTTFLKGLNTSIELTGGHALPVVALDTDGITLPLILSHTIDHLAELTRRDSVRAVKCAAGAGFMLWRFIDLAKYSSPRGYKLRSYL